MSEIEFLCLIVTLNFFLFNDVIISLNKIRLCLNINRYKY